jgi:hypothetical protein
MLMHRQSLMVTIVIISDWLLAGQPGLNSYFGAGYSLYHHIHNISEALLSLFEML